jgi:hypothetical protein
MFRTRPSGLLPLPRHHPGLGEVCFWPAPHNFISEEGAEIIQFSTAGGLAAQAKIVQEFFAKKMQK